MTPRTWPSRDDLRKMSPSEVNRFLASLGVSLRVRDDSALVARHAEVCLCPFDGSDPGCNLLMNGVELAALRTPKPEGEPE